MKNTEILHFFAFFYQIIKKIAAKSKKTHGRRDFFGNFRKSPEFFGRAAYNSRMRAEVLRELGLSPVWKRRAAPRRPDDNRQNPAATAKSAAAANPAAPEKSAARAETAAAPIAPPPHNAPARGETDSAIPPAAAPEESAIARMRWQPLRETVAACRRCELCQMRKQAVFGVGDEDADIFFVGEGPGQEEDRLGEPFVGAAGQLLDAMLKSIGISRESGVYIANIVKCRPPQNRKPKPAEAAACMPYLHRQLALSNPRLIVALGGVAAAHLLQTNEPVGALRQRMHTYQGTPLVVTYHPAYLLRSPTEKRKSWNDLRMIRRLAAKPE